MDRAFLKELLQAAKVYNSVPEFQGHKFLIELIPRLEEYTHLPILDPHKVTSPEADVSAYFHVPDWFKKSEICTDVPYIRGDGPQHAACSPIHTKISNRRQTYRPCKYNWPDSHVYCFDMTAFFRAPTPYGQEILEKFVTIEINKEEKTWVHVEVFYNGKLNVNTSRNALTPIWIRRLNLGIASAQEGQSFALEEGALGVNEWTE